MSTDCPVIDDGYRDDELPDRAVPVVNCLPLVSVADASPYESGRESSNSDVATSQYDQLNENELPYYPAASGRFSTMMSAYGGFAVGSNPLEDEVRQAMAPDHRPDHYPTTEEIERVNEHMEAQAELNNIVHKQFYNRFDDLFDDEDLN